MSKHTDDWQKLASYDTNLQGELHANLLKNNGINVSLQALSAIPGMNSGAVLWVRNEELLKAKQILDNIDKNSENVRASDLKSCSNPNSGNEKE